MFDVKLDSEENELLASVEQGEWDTAPNFEEELALAQNASANSLRKDERITLRISSGDLDCLKQKAAYKGLPYQTFIASVLHEYAAGRRASNCQQTLNHAKISFAVRLVNPAFSA